MLSGSKDIWEKNQGIKKTTFYVRAITVDSSVKPTVGRTKPIKTEDSVLFLVSEGNPLIVEAAVYDGRTCERDGFQANGETVGVMDGRSSRSTGNDDLTYSKWDGKIAYCGKM